jgi:hypothetical protein
MIVFTATNKATKEVYVGSARDSMEEHWARLIVQAEEGGSGEFLEMVRESGAEQIEVETWAYADSLAESRELVRDACDEFGAKLIKTGRAPAPTASSLSNATTSSTDQDERSAPAASADISSIHGSSQASAEKSNVSSINARMNAIAAAAKAPAAKKNTAPEKPSSATINRETQKQHGPVTKIDVNAYLSAQQTDKEDESPQSDVIALRKTESTKVADDMKTVMMNIEMKRRQNRACSPTNTASKAKKSSKSVGTASSKKNGATSINKSSTAKKDKLPDGRVSSSAKEKRIKEAIAQERMERESAQAAKAAAEAKEMAEIMAKLDQRSKEKESLRRRR